MSRLIKLPVGTRSGRLTTVSPVFLGTSRGKQMSMVDCSCDCGGLYTARACDIKSKDVQFCGLDCSLREMNRFDHQKIIDLIDQGYSRDEITEIIGCSGTTVNRVARETGHKRYCNNCGKPISLSAPYGFCPSCWSVQRFVDHPLYHTWKSIKYRCYNPRSKSYKNYGGRGIKISDLWVDNFTAFEEWIDSNLGQKPYDYSLDRIDNNGDYEPGNLRWASAQEQRRNTRNVREHILDLNNWNNISMLASFGKGNKEMTEILRDEFEGELRSLVKMIDLRSAELRKKFF